ncbi:MAG TPA: hypothetical protein PLY45_00500 [bacterium]|nr:hypothetical protein [bacterium]
MSDIAMKTVAKKLSCDSVPDCAATVEQYINEQPQKIFDSYSCTATPVMQGGAGGEYLKAFLVLCTGTPKAPLPIKK